MFTGNDIQARVKQLPFVPLRIITSAGEQYDIPHPDLIMVGVRYLVVGTSSAANPTIFEKTSLVAVGHITALENLPATGNAAPNANGQ